MPSVPSRYDFLTIVVKNYAKTDSKIFCSTYFSAFYLFFPNILSIVVEPDYRKIAMVAEA